MSFFNDDDINEALSTNPSAAPPTAPTAGVGASFLRGLGRGASFGFYEPKIGEGESSTIPSVAGDIVGSVASGLPLMWAGGLGAAQLGRLGGIGARFLPAIARGAEEAPEAAAAIRAFMKPSAVFHPYKTAGEVLSKTGGVAAGAGAGLADTLLRETGEKSRTGKGPDDPIWDLSRGAALGGLGGAFLGKSGRMSRALSELKPPVSPLEEMGPQAGNEAEKLLKQIGGMHTREQTLVNDLRDMAGKGGQEKQITRAEKELVKLRKTKASAESELAGMGGPEKPGATPGAGGYDLAPPRFPEEPGATLELGPPMAEQPQFPMGPEPIPSAQGELPLAGEAPPPKPGWGDTPLGQYGASGQAGLSDVQRAAGQVSDRGVDEGLAQLGNRVTPADPEQARRLLTQGLEEQGASTMRAGNTGAYSPGSMVGSMSPEAVAQALQEMSKIGALGQSTLTEGDARTKLIALIQQAISGAAPGLNAEQLIQNLKPEQIAAIVRDFGIGGTTSEQTARAVLTRVLGGALPPPPFAEAALVSPVDWGKKLGNIFPGNRIQEPERLSQAVDAIQAGHGGIVPTDEAIQARVAGDTVFPDIRMPCSELCEDSVKQSRLAASAASPRTFLKSQNEWIQKAAKIFPVGWVLRGSGADGLVEHFYQMDGVSHGIASDVLKRTAEMAGLPKNDLQTFQRLVHEYQDSPRIDFERAIAQELPQHIDVIKRYQALQDRIGQVYIADGSLSPDKLKLNYHPSYREKLQATADGVLRIEKGDGFYPIPIENMIRAHVPWSLRNRTWTDPEDWARMDFGTQLKIQAYQFGRHMAVRQYRDQIEEKMAMAEPELKQYVGDYVNYMLGNRAAHERVGAINGAIRDLQFVRTIGANVMSPITYTFQRMNTFALTSPKAFMQAFADMRDPTRLQLLQDIGYGNILRMGDDAAQMATGSGPGSGILKKISTVSGKWFSSSMRDNQIHAFMAGLRDGEAKGFTGKDLTDYASNIMVDTQFIHSQANLPAIYRSNFGRIMGQFQQFRMNQTEFMTRLLTQAGQGDVKPLLKFWGPVVLMAGMSGLPFGEFLEDHATRFAFGRAMHIPGIAEALFGVSLGHQMGIGTIGGEDLGSWLYYLPGPSVSYIQQLIGATTGYNAGSGADLSGLGEELRPSQRYRSLVDLAPGGIQANRVAQVLRLYQNDGEFRDSMDFSSFLGLTPPQGALLADRAATLQEQLFQGTGFRLKFREDERNRNVFMQGLERDMVKTKMRMADFLESGDQQSAMKEKARFDRKYAGRLPTGGLELNNNELKKAAIRRLVPPGARMRMPKELGGFEGSYWNPKPNIEWWKQGG